VQQFGSYNIFWTLLYRQFPNVFERLSGNAVISKLDIEYLEKEIDEPGWVQSLADDYWFELVDTFKPLPSDIEEEYLRMKARRVERGIDTTPRKQEMSDENVKQLRKKFSASTMGRELKEIAEARWTDEPHWKFT